MNILIRRYRNISAWFILITLFSVTGQLSADTKSPGDYDQINPMLITVSSDAYSGADVINLDEMNEMRGGFSFGGLKLKFGATLSTLIDSIKLETVFSITSQGAQVVSQMLTHLGMMKETVSVASNSPSVITESNGSGTGNAETTVSTQTNAILVGPETGVSVSDLAPVDFKLDGVNSSNGFSGVVVSSNKGFTTALHKLTKDAAISAIISNASNVRASQKLDIKINIQNAKSTAKAAKAAALSKIAGGMFSR